MRSVLRPKLLAAVVMSCVLAAGSAGAQTLVPSVVPSVSGQPAAGQQPSPDTASLTPPALANSAAAQDGLLLERERFPFANLFKDLVSDVKHLPSRDNAWIAGIGAGLALASHQGDHSVAMNAPKPGNFEEVFDGGAVAGGGLAQIGAAFGAYAVGRFSGNDKLAAVGRDLVRAQVFNTILTQGIKLAVQRERPDGSDSYSFPSGHASTAFATATVLQRYYGLKVGLPAYALATYVATSRLTENKHYLSDVAFGAAIGVIAGRTSTLHLGGSAFAIAPMIGPHGGAGISLVKVPMGSVSH
jgi:membrane-associated phospholipid phosphatase